MKFFKDSWFLKKIKKYPTITFIFSLYSFYYLFSFLVAYFSNQDLTIENIPSDVQDFFGYKFWIPYILIMNFLFWLLVVWIASKLPQDRLKEKFFRHPVASIIIFILYITDIPRRLAEYSSRNLIDDFQTILSYAFVCFVWWLLICWISSKIFKRQRFQWHWYKKLIEKIFRFLPIIYKIILGLITVLVLLGIILFIVHDVFQYSGNDLDILFN